MNDNVKPFDGDKQSLKDLIGKEVSTKAKSKAPASINASHNSQAAGRDINNVIYQANAPKITIVQQKKVYALVKRIAKLDHNRSIADLWNEVGDLGNAPRQDSNILESRYHLIPETNFNTVKIFLLNKLNDLLETALFDSEELNNNLASEVVSKTKEVEKLIAEKHESKDMYDALMERRTLQNDTYEADIMILSDVVEKQQSELVNLHSALESAANVISPIVDAKRMLDSMNSKADVGKPSNIAMAALGVKYTP